MRCPPGGSLSNFITGCVYPNGIDQPADSEEKKSWFDVFLKPINGHFVFQPITEPIIEPVEESNSSFGEGACNMASFVPLTPS